VTVTVGTAAVWWFSPDGTLQDGLGTSHTGFYGDRAKGAIAPASPALHTGVPIRYEHVPILLIEDCLRANVQTDTAIPASFRAEAQCHHIF
jgi:hypothetical protein